MQCKKIDAQLAAEYYANAVAPLPACDATAGAMVAIFASTVTAAVLTIVAGAFFNISIQWPSVIAITGVGAGTFQTLRIMEQRHEQARAWIEKVIGVQANPGAATARNSDDQP